VTPDNGSSTDPDDSTTQSLASLAQVDGAINNLCRQAKHYLYVRAPRLDFPFFKSNDLLPSITHLIRGDQRNHIHFLIDDELHFLNTNTRLIELARNFSSYVKVHKLPEEYADTAELYIVADTDCYLHMASQHQYPATAGFDMRARTRQLEYRFKQLWERSERIPELFTLGL
jgi:hypothetical protein